MLEAAGIPVETMGAELDERAVEARLPDSPPDVLAMLLAREKARTVAAKCPGCAVLGADQILAVNGRRFSKARDRASARDQLMALAGRAHALYSSLGIQLFDRIEGDHFTILGLPLIALLDFFRREGWLAA